ncbi:MAG: efflux transporter outer membrane subunit [Bosea sp.]|nr:efflux transporter outer membrane subunit [Bosea sp. (in: a-proteobacteria)]MCP4738297.1 efflux transporter outer membrane subunit [Bosea sp. (in: a-proteobacteria)]
MPRTGIPHRGPARFRRLAAAAALALALEGCLPALDKPEAGIPAPDHYRASPSREEAHPPQPSWWRGFRSRPLDDLIAAANAGNLDIAVAAAQIAQAEAQAGIAAAPLFPTLDAAGSAERIRTPATSSTSAAVRSQFGLGLSASYMVDFWGKNRSGLLAAEQNLAAAHFNEEVVRLTAQVTVANSYFQVLAARDQIAVARENLAAANRILELVRRQFTAGTVSELDVAQQEALVATVRTSIPPLEVTLEQNTAALAVLVGRVAATMRPPSGKLAAMAIPRVTPGLPSELLRRRPDVRLAEAQLEASGFSVEAARAAMLPQIQLTGTAGVQSAALRSLFVPGAWYYTLAAGLTQPIFDGFLLESQLKQAKGVQLQDLQSYRKAILSAFADVEKALVALDRTSRQLRLQADVVASSRKAFDVAEAQLRGGTANQISVLQAQQTLFTAQSAMAEVRLNRLLAATSLFQALGGGWGDR